MQCETCEKPIDSENDLKRGLCFACHLGGLRFGFGPQFKNPMTIREQQRQMESSKDFKDGKIEPIPARAILR